MFDIFNKILEYVPIIGSDTRCLAEISNTIASEGSTSTSSSDIETVIAHIQQVTLEDKYFTKTGIITLLNEEHGYIDNYYFDRNSATKKVRNLKKGMKVSYTAYKVSDDLPIKIHEIDHIIDGILDNKETNDELDIISPEFFEAHELLLESKIVEKRKNMITIEHDDFMFNLENVNSDFVPQVNDRIILKYTLEKNEDYEDEMNIIAIYPPRRALGVGIIREFNNDMGFIEKTNEKYYFHANVLENGYKPEVGDKVNFEAIESEHFEYSYRCLKIVYLTSKKPKEKIKHSTHESNVKDNEEVIEAPVYRDFNYSSQVYNIPIGDVVPGERTVKKPNFMCQKIDPYTVPRELMKSVLSHKTTTDVSNTINEILPFLLNAVEWKNYKKYFHSLIYLEEIQFFHNMRTYDVQCGHFQKDEEFLTLNIDNLSERRPSLAIGDSLIAFPIANTSSASFEGFIHRIMKDRICLKFNKGFHDSYNGEDYKLIFQFSRMKLRKMHHALDRGIDKLGESFFLPKKIVVRETQQLDVILDEHGNLKRDGFTRIYPWFNNELNIVQKHAILNILRGETRPMPYILFGPPGTGKTITLIETILQIAACIPDSRILVATPSNNSANLITERLMGYGIYSPDEMIRIVSHNMIEKELISDNIAQYCATLNIALQRTIEDESVETESGIRLKLCQTDFENHRITIGTCVTLGTFYQMGLAHNHYTHIIVDEAGQCLEPEIMIPISFINKANGQVVLAGDPMQLNPIVLSPHATYRGFNKSFLVRILEQFPYKYDIDRFPPSGYDQRLITKLIYNYRSIPTVLKVYNDLFYDSKLIPQISDVDSREIKILNSLKSILPNAEKRNPKCGLFFYNVQGVNMKNSDSPSWYNDEEAHLVYQFVTKLYSKFITPDNIGIITPYQKQVRVIKNNIESQNLKVPKIGSVEEFQGQEKDIILISTVRSNCRNIGFVKEPKRLNVAISRATTLIVVFGNAQTLSEDKNWKRLINIAKDNNTFVTV